jgi:hypothetical protein
MLTSRTNIRKPARRDPKHFLSCIVELRFAHTEPPKEPPDRRVVIDKKCLQIRTVGAPERS